MQDEGIADREIVGIRDNLIGIGNNGINLDAPRLMPDNPLTMFARRLNIVAIAVIPDSGTVVGHKKVLPA
jgi:hypothetical protein